MSATDDNLIIPSRTSDYVFGKFPFLKLKHTKEALFFRGGCDSSGRKIVQPASRESSCYINLVQFTGITAIEVIACYW